MEFDFKGPNASVTGGTVLRRHAVILQPDHSLDGISITTNDPDTRNKLAKQNAEFAMQNNGGPTICIATGDFRYGEPWCARLSCGCGFFEIFDSYAQCVENIPDECHHHTQQQEDCPLYKGKMRLKYEVRR